MARTERAGGAACGFAAADFIRSALESRMGDVTGGAGGGAGGTNSVSSGDEAGPECQVGFVALGRLECAEGRAFGPC